MRLVRAFSQFKDQWVHHSVRKAKSWIPEKYPAIPEHQKHRERDAFNYKLQTKEQVAEQRKRIGDIPMSVTHEELFDTIAHKDEYIRKCVIVFNMNDCGFSPKQMERFKFLVGTRLNHKNGYVKFSVRQFTEWEYNYNRAVEMIKETLLEAYRAPQEEELPDISEVIQAERSKKDAKNHTEQSSSA